MTKHFACQHTDQGPQHRGPEEAVAPQLLSPVDNKRLRDGYRFDSAASAAAESLQTGWVTRVKGQKKKQ